ncbi:MAG: antirestriction protein [Thiobacillus sp.]|nr:antirestriction protein [Thiobacillus sp.]
MNTTITRHQLEIDRRISHTAALFGVHFPMQLEPYVYSVTSELANEYHGGYWQFYTLSNGGFYMAPNADQMFRVSCENGYEGDLSSDALGIAACLYAYSHLSFADDAFAETCAEQYHLLRDYMLEHAEARGILGAID